MSKDLKEARELAMQIPEGRAFWKKGMSEKP
jgi:hypothetical protein